MDANNPVCTVAQTPDVVIASPRTSVSFLPLCFTNPGFEDTQASQQTGTKSPGTTNVDEDIQHDLTLCNHSNCGVSNVDGVSGNGKLRYRRLLQKYSSNVPTLRFGHSEAEEQLRLRIYMQSSGRSSSSSSSVSSSRSCSCTSVSCSQSSIIAEVGAAQTARTRTNRALLQWLVESQALQLGHCNDAHNMPGPPDSPGSPSEHNSSQEEQDSSTPMEYECSTMSQPDDIAAILLAMDTAEGQGTITMEAGAPTATTAAFTLTTSSITNTATAEPIQSPSAPSIASTKATAATTNLAEVHDGTLSDSQQQSSHSATTVAASAPMYDDRPQIGQRRAQQSRRAPGGKKSQLMAPGVVSLQEQQWQDQDLLRQGRGGGEEGGDGSEQPVGRASQNKLGQLLARKSQQLRLDQERQMQHETEEKLIKRSPWQPMDPENAHPPSHGRRSHHPAAEPQDSHIASTACCTHKQHQQQQQATQPPPPHHQCQSVPDDQDHDCQASSIQRDHRQATVNLCNLPRYRSATAAQRQENLELTAQRQHRCASPYSSEESSGNGDDDLMEEGFVWPPARLVRDQLVKVEARRRERQQRRRRVSRGGAANVVGEACCCSLHGASDVQGQKLPSQWPPQSLPWRGCPVHLTVRVAAATCQEASRLRRRLLQTATGDPLLRRRRQTSSKSVKRRGKSGSGGVDQCRRPVSGVDCSVHGGGGGGGCGRETSATRKVCR